MFDSKRATFAKILALTLLLTISLYSATSEKEIQPPQAKEKKLDYRIFLGGGFGMGFDKKTDSVSTTYQIFPVLNIFFVGAEFIFDGGSGFNIVGNLSVPYTTIGANYVYEYPGSVKWAFLTGFDMGVRPGLGEYRLNNAFGVRYNIEARLRIKRHAISLKLPFPLFSSSAYLCGYGGCDSTRKFKVYGFFPSINYTYFFGL